MAKKKILLFIVEGPTDETSLSTVLSRIFSSDEIKFHVVHGDVLTRNFAGTDGIKKAVYAQIKSFCDRSWGIYNLKDICRVVHLTDTDGVFVTDEAVIKEDIKGKKYPFYTDSQILTPKPANIIDRNVRKSSNIAKLSSTGRIGGIPYSFYYFSCNLDHVLYDKRNSTDDEKERNAYSFAKRYKGDREGFVEFICNSDFSVGTYQETWAFIKQGVHSLERHSNFGIELPDQCEWEPPT